MFNYWKIVSCLGIWMLLFMGLCITFEKQANPAIGAERVTINVSKHVDSDGSISHEDTKLNRARRPPADILRNAPICHDLPVTESYLDVDDWQTVIDDVLYVYSAHLDPRPRTYNIVRIFGIISRDELSRAGRQYYCQISSNSTDSVYVIESGKYKVAEPTSPKFRMVEFQCRINANAWALPELIVSVTTKACSKPNNRLVVRQNHKHGFRTNFTLCLGGVLKHGISSTSQLVEWMELNMLLGAEHVFAYNFSGSKKLDPYLTYYERRSRLTVMPWRLPIQLRDDLDEINHDFKIVWNYGQTVMLNDCLYRNMFVAKNLVYIDLDEFIIPQREDTQSWQIMLAHAKQNCTPNVGSFCARNSFFHMYKINESNMDAFNLTTALHTVMFSRVKECFGRSKYIVIPERIGRLNIHFVEEYYNSSYEPCIIDPSVGLLHHYKALNRHKPTEVNLAALKFKNNITERMARVFSKSLTKPYE